MQQSTGWCVVWWKANAKKFYLSSCTMRVAYHFWCLLWGTPKNECNNQLLWFFFAFDEKQMQNMQPVINFNECCISLLVFVARNTKKLPTINQLVSLLIRWKTNEKNATSHHFRWEFPFHFWFLLRGTPKVNETINSVVRWKANTENCILLSLLMRVAYHFWCSLWETPKNECNNQWLVKRKQKYAASHHFRWELHITFGAN